MCLREILEKSVNTLEIASRETEIQFQILSHIVPKFWC